MTPWRIRRIQEGDAPAMLLLARSLDKWFNAEGLAQMARDLAGHEGYVAVRGERILGFITWAPAGEGVANLSWMGVDEREQRSGIGRALLRALVADLRAAGLRVLEVSTVADTVDYPPYAATRAFYRAEGFADHRLDEKYFGTGEDRYDRLLLRLDLAA